MSIEAMTWAMRHSEATLGARLVLFVLADYAHHDGSEAYPSVATIGERAHLSRRAVQLALRKLEEAGEIASDGVGRNGTTCWRLNMGGAQNLRGRSSTHEGGVTATPKPPKEPSTSLSTEKETLAEPQTSDGFLGELLVAHENGNSAAPRVKHNGREVPRLLVQEATQALEHFNAQAGRHCSPFTGRGKPSESLSRIIGAMLDWPAVRVEWRRMIDRSLADPWWDGPASTGCIFGPKVVEASLARATMPQRQAPSMRGLTPSGRAIAKLLAADGR